MQLKRATIFSIGIGFLLIGLLPYILWEQEIMFLRPFENLLPAELDYHGFFYEKIIRNHLGDLSWVLALIILQEALSDERMNIFNYLACLLPIICELGQIQGLLPGTFDIIDLLIYIIVITTYLIWKRKRS